MPRTARGLLFLALAALFAPTPGSAHDASAYGGLFRSRSMGGNWLNADVGLYLNAALTVAVDPRDANHLLMGTDSGLWASANGGRSWAQEAPTLINGAVFAIAFSPDGAMVLCAAPGGVYRNFEGRWGRSDAPTEATPGRSIVFSGSGRIYLLGRDRLFSSNDGGAHFARCSRRGRCGRLRNTRPASPAGRDTCSPSRMVVCWPARTADGAGSNGRSDDAVEPIETVIADPAVAGRVWVAAANRLHVSSDGGVNWQPVGSRFARGAHGGAWHRR